MFVNEPAGEFHGTFEHGGRALSYDVYEGDSERTLVYLHGLLLDSTLNRSIARELAARGNRVVLLDLLGHGGSDKPTHAAEYRIDVYSEQVVALLDHLEIDRAVLGGLSLGANVSLFTAVHERDRVRALILEMPVLERATPSAALVFVALLLTLHYAERPARLLTRIASHLPRPGIDLVDTLLSAASTDPEAMAAILHGVLLGPVGPTAEQRQAIDVPVLVLAHRYDLIHPFSDAVALVRYLPNGRLLRSRTPVELRLRPHRLTKEIATFLDAAWKDESFEDQLSP